MAGSENQPVSHDPHRLEQASTSSAPNQELSPVKKEQTDQERMFTAVREQALREVARAIATSEFDPAKFNKLHIGALNPHASEGLLVFDASYIPLSEEEAKEATMTAREILMLEREQQLLDARRAASRETDESYARQLADEADVAARLEEAQKALGKHIAVETHRPTNPQAEATIMASLDTPAYRRALAAQAAGTQDGNMGRETAQDKKPRTTQVIATAGYILTSLVPAEAIVSEVSNAQADATPEATDDPDQDPLANPTPPIHRVFLPFGLRPRMPGDETPTEETPPPLPTNTPTEYAPPEPSPSNTIAATATYSPTATVEIPTATPELPATPEHREIQLDADSILYLSVDRNSLWAKPGDIKLENLKTDVIGKTAEGLVLIRTSYGDLLVQPPQDFDMATIPEVASPRRKIVFADESSPIRMDAGLSDTKIQYLPVTWTEVGQNQSYTYTFNGEIEEGRTLQIHHNEKFTVGLKRLEGSAYSLEYKGASGQHSEPITFDTTAGPIGIRLSQGAGGNIAEIIQTIGKDETVIGTVEIGALSEGKVYLSLIGGGAHFDNLTFEAAPSTPRGIAELRHEDRIDSGIFAKTGIRVGLVHEVAVGAGPEAQLGHRLGQEAHFDLGYSTFSLTQTSREHQIDYIREQLRASRNLGLTPVSYFQLNNLSAGTKSAGEIREFITTIQSFGSGGDLALGIIGGDGKIDLSDGALEAFNQPRANTLAATYIIEELSRDMGSASAFKEEGVPQVNLVIPVGFTARGVKELKDTITDIRARGGTIDGVFIHLGYNTIGDLKSILTEMKALGLRTTLLEVDGSHSRAPLKALANLGTLNLLDAIVPQDGANPTTLLTGDNSYNRAGSNGPISGTPFGDFMSEFDGLNNEDTGSTDWDPLDQI